MSKVLQIWLWPEKIEVVFQVTLAKFENGSTPTWPQIYLKVI